MLFSPQNVSITIRSVDLITFPEGSPMNSRILALAGAMLAALSVLAWTKPAAADDAAPTKIGICDPIKVLNQIQEGKDAMAKWKQDGDTLTNQATVKKGQLQTESDEIKL